MSKPSEQSAKQSVNLSPPSDNPSLRFYHSDSLRTKTLAVLTTLEQAQDCTRHRDALSNIVLELTDSGFEYYFLRPLKLAKVSFVVEQSAHLGLVSVKRVLSPVIRNIIGHMDQVQLLTVCIHIRQLMM
jgi:hypothetical protein